jgi:hypothetical protein
MRAGQDHGREMAKAQHTSAYRAVPAVLRQLRAEAGLTQRALAARMNRPQSWVYNCETANRRVDVTEFIAWCRACGADPLAAVAALIKSR